MKFSDFLKKILSDFSVDSEKIPKKGAKPKICKKEI